MTINLKNLLNPKAKKSKMREFQELKSIDGLQISAISADLYGDGRDDLTLFFFNEGANFGAVYTNSKITSHTINWKF
jgi:glutamate N-acetyltransferase/amino-acid N-acetyltransferase